MQQFTFNDVAQFLRPARRPARQVTKYICWCLKIFSAPHNNISNHCRAASSSGRCTRPSTRSTPTTARPTWAGPPRHTTPSGCRLELETKAIRKFAKISRRRTLLGLCRGLLRYYEPLDGHSFQALLQGDNPHLRGGARAVSFRRPIRQSRNLRPEVLPKMFQDSVFKTDTAPVADPFRYKSSDDFDESSLFKSFLFNLP